MEPVSEYTLISNVHNEHFAFNRNFIFSNYLPRSTDFSGHEISLQSISFNDRYSKNPESEEGKPTKIPKNQESVETQQAAGHRIQTRGVIPEAKTTAGIIPLSSTASGETENKKPSMEFFKSPVDAEINVQQQVYNDLTANKNLDNFLSLLNTDFETQKIPLSISQYFTTGDDESKKES